MKLAIVVGHNARAQGAIRVTDRRTEFDWNSDLAELIKAHNPEGVRIFHRTPGGGYAAEIDRVYNDVNKYDPHAIIELHFNASADASASGGETLSSGTDGSLRLAKIVREKISAVLGNRDRGVKVRKRHERGGRSLWQGRAPTVLAEPYFGSNAAECVLATKHMDELAEAYYRAAVEFVGAPNVSPLIDPQEQRLAQMAQALKKIHELTKPFA